MSQRNSHGTVVLSGALSIFLSLSPLAAFAAELSLQDLDFPKSFSVQSSYYTIESVDSTAEEPGFLKFRVHSSHATYEVEGLLPLQKLLHEIEVIERIKRDEAGSGFVDGAVDSVKATGSGFVRLVAHPIQSGKGVGQAVGKLGGKVGGIFRKKEEGEKSSFGEKLLGGSERELAKEFRVDVYTTNPYMQELLRGMARARLSGKGAALIGKLLIPVSGLAAVTLTASGLNSAADQLVNDTSRSDLFLLNKESLLSLGFAPQEVNDLLNLPYYSPREATYLRFYLEKLKEVQGFREIPKTALQAKSLWQARKILYEAQMAAGATGEIPKYKKIECFPEGLAISEGNRTLFITPYDYLEPSPLGERVTARVSELKEVHPVEMWNACKVSYGFFSRNFLKGVLARSWVLFNQE